MRREITTKTCKGCGVDKSRANYYRASANRDGLNARCKTCYEAKRNEKKNK